jgi:hypothetical protein
MENKNPGQGLGIASMVLGILGLAVPFGEVLALVGLILGAVSKKKSNEAGMPSGMATAGIVCSIIALAISIVCTIVCWAPMFCAGGTLATMGF